MSFFRARIFGSVAALVVLASPAIAQVPVGERHLTAMVGSAPLRDAVHSAGVRVTVWYPAAAGAKGVAK